MQAEIAFNPNLTGWTAVRSGLSARDFNRPRKEWTKKAFQETTEARMPVHQIHPFFGVQMEDS